MSHRILSIAALASLKETAAKLFSEIEADNPSKYEEQLKTVQFFMDELESQLDGLVKQYDALKGQIYEEHYKAPGEKTG